MAASGTVTEISRSPESLQAQWVLDSPTNNQYSAPIDCRGYDILEYYLSAYPGYVDGTNATVGLLANTDQTTPGTGLIPEQNGRHIRAEKTSLVLNQAGYLTFPPPSILLTVGNHDGNATSYTVLVIARRV